MPRPALLLSLQFHIHFLQLKHLSKNVVQYLLNFNKVNYLS